MPTLERHYAAWFDSPSQPTHKERILDDFYDVDIGLVTRLEIAGVIGERTVFNLNPQVFPNGANILVAMDDETDFTAAWSALEEAVSVTRWFIVVEVVALDKEVYAEIGEEWGPWTVDMTTRSWLTDELRAGYPAHKSPFCTLTRPIQAFGEDWTSPTTEIDEVCERLRMLGLAPTNLPRPKTPEVEAVSTAAAAQGKWKKVPVTAQVRDGTRIVREIRKRGDRATQRHKDEVDFAGRSTREEGRSRNQESDDLGADEERFVDEVQPKAPRNIIHDAHKAIGRRISPRFEAKTPEGRYNAMLATIRPLRLSLPPPLPTSEQTTWSLYRTYLGEDFHFYKSVPKRCKDAYETARVHLELVNEASSDDDDKHCGGRVERRMKIVVNGWVYSGDERGRKASIVLEPVKVRKERERTGGKRLVRGV